MSKAPLTGQKIIFIFIGRNAMFELDRLPGGIERVAFVDVAFWSRF